MSSLWGPLHLLLALVPDPGGGTGNPLQYSCLGSPMERGAIVHGVTKSQTRLNMHASTRRACTVPWACFHVCNLIHVMAMISCLHSLYKNPELCDLLHLTKSYTLSTCLLDTKLTILFFLPIFLLCALLHFLMSIL